MRTVSYWTTLPVFFLFSNLAMGQTPPLSNLTSPTVPATTNTPAAANAIPLANVVTEADATTAKLHDIDNSLETDPTLAEVDETLSRITHEIDEHQDENGRLVNADTSLASLRSVQKIWQTLAENLDLPKKILVDRITALDAQVKQLGDWSLLWQATLASAKSSGAPPNILQKINDLLTALGLTTKAAESLRTQTLSAQGRVAEQGSRIDSAVTAIQKAQKSALSVLFTRDSEPLWNLNIRSASEGPAGQDSIVIQIEALRSYLREKALTLIIHFLGFIILAVTLVRVRREVDARANTTPALQHAAGVLDVPLATAALLALLISTWLYPLAPRLFLSGIEAAALIPAVVILRHLIAPSLFSILYAMIVFYILDQMRNVTASSEIAARGLFIFELILGTLFLTWLLRSRRTLSIRTLSEWAVEVYAHAALVLFVVSGLSNVLGYVHLSGLLGNATFSSSYLAVILYAVVRIGNALTLSALQIRPLSRVGLVRRHHARLAQCLSRIFIGAAAFFWLWTTLDLFAVRGSLWAKGTALLTTQIGWATHVFTLGDILAFGVTVWASFLISKVIRFVLEEEIYQHLKLPPGVPYTASTLIHYLVLLIGFFAALQFLDIRLSNFAVLAGAFGVGLGFGLQNIMNNFVSGLILLFERPIKVGDIIQVDTAMGTVERIGIRASVILISDGSEIIVPNGNLISGQVTNWTFSNRRRMIAVPVTIVSKSDPQHALALLVKIAQDHPLVLKEPQPQALATNLTANSLTLELRVWTNNPDQWIQIRSDLSVAINAALVAENIATA